MIAAKVCLDTFVEASSPFEGSGVGDAMARALRDRGCATGS